MFIIMLLVETYQKNWEDKKMLFQGKTYVAKTLSF